MFNIYTDGSCLKPNGPGGWAFCAVVNNIVFCDSGGSDNTTNNRMELIAVIEAIQFLDPGAECVIHTDSLLTMNCAMRKWKRNCNLDLWAEFDLSLKDKKVDFVWVKAHDNNYYNCFVDKMALEQARKISKCSP